MEKLNIFNKIDAFIFSKLDALKSDTFFLKTNEMLMTLDEKQQKITTQAITFAVLILPFTIALGLWYINFQTKKSIEIKKDIIEQVALFDSTNSSLNQLSYQAISPSGLMSQNDLDNIMRNILSQNAIDQSKVSIKEFFPGSSDQHIIRSQATISFNRFGTQDLSKFLRMMIDREKFRILDVNFEKDTSNELLQGTMNIIHIGRNNNMNE